MPRLAVCTELFELSSTGSFRMCRAAVVYRSALVNAKRKIVEISICSASGQSDTRRASRSEIIKPNCLSYELRSAGVFRTVGAST